MRHDEEFAFPQLHYPVAKFDPHPAAPNEEQFVFRVVMVPRKCSLEFYKLHFLAIQFRDDLGPPMLPKGRELFREVHFFHRRNRSTSPALLFVLQSPRALR